MPTRHHQSEGLGSSPENPIPVNGIDGEEAYLSSLWCACGNPMTWERRGSLGERHTDHFQGMCSCGRERTLYLNMYNAECSTHCPDDLRIVTRDPQGRHSSVILVREIDAEDLKSIDVSDG